MGAKIRHGPKGFLITFANGYSASVQYGLGNYCERRDMTSLTLVEPEPDEITSHDFELAVWKDRDKEWVPLSPGDSVKGWIPFDMLPRVLALVQDANFDELRRYLDMV